MALFIAAEGDCWLVCGWDLVKTMEAMKTLEEEL